MVSKESAGGAAPQGRPDKARLEAGDGGRGTGGDKEDGDAAMRKRSRSLADLAGSEYGAAGPAERQRPRTSMADRQARTPERPRPGGFNLLASPNLMLGSGALPLFQPSPHRNTLTSPVKQFSLNGLGSLFGSPTFTSNGDITSELKELMSFPLMTPPRNQQSLPQPQHGLHFADMFAAGLHAHTETGSSRNADAEGFRMGDDGLDFEDSELAAVIFSSPTAKAALGIADHDGPSDLLQRTSGDRRRRLDFNKGLGIQQAAAAGILLGRQGMLEPASGSSAASAFVLGGGRDGAQPALQQPARAVEVPVSRSSGPRSGSGTPARRAVAMAAPGSATRGAPSSRAGQSTLSEGSGGSGRSRGGNNNSSAGRSSSVSRRSGTARPPQPPQQQPQHELSVARAASFDLAPPGGLSRQESVGPMPFSAIGGMAIPCGMPAPADRTGAGAAAELTTQPSFQSLIKLEAVAKDASGAPGAGAPSMTVLRPLPGMPRLQAQQQRQAGAGDAAPGAQQQPGPAPPLSSATVAASLAAVAVSLDQQNEDALNKTCRCKKSACLKLYCDCFAAGMYCANCSCMNCMNKPENSQMVMEKRSSIQSRDPEAFSRKIQIHLDPVDQAAKGRHKKGCNCRRSHCLKKYCECFQAGVHCALTCKCVDCHNMDTSSMGLNHQTLGASQATLVAATPASKGSGRQPPQQVSTVGGRAGAAAASAGGDSQQQRGGGGAAAAAAATPAAAQRSGMQMMVASWAAGMVASGASAAAAGKAKAAATLPIPAISLPAASAAVAALKMTAALSLPVPCTMPNQGSVAPSAAVTAGSSPAASHAGGVAPLTTGAMGPPPPAADRAPLSGSKLKPGSTALGGGPHRLSPSKAGPPPLVAAAAEEPAAAAAGANQGSGPITGSAGRAGPVGKADADNSELSIAVPPPAGARTGVRRNIMSALGPGAQGGGGGGGASAWMQQRGCPPADLGISSAGSSKLPAGHATDTVLPPEEGKAKLSQMYPQVKPASYQPPAGYGASGKPSADGKPTGGVKVEAAMGGDPITAPAAGAVSGGEAGVVAAASGSEQLEVPSSIQALAQLSASIMQQMRSGKGGEGKRDEPASGSRRSARRQAAVAAAEAEAAEAAAPVATSIPVVQAIARPRTALRPGHGSSPFMSPDGSAKRPGAMQAGTTRVFGSASAVTGAAAAPSGAQRMLGGGGASTHDALAQAGAAAASCTPGSPGLSGMGLHRRIRSTDSADDLAGVFGDGPLDLGLLGDEAFGAFDSAGLLGSPLPRLDAATHGAMQRTPSKRKAPGDLFRFSLDGGLTSPPAKLRALLQSPVISQSPLKMRLSPGKHAFGGATPSHGAIGATGAAAALAAPSASASGGGGGCAVLLGAAGLPADLQQQQQQYPASPFGAAKRHVAAVSSPQEGSAHRGQPLRQLAGDGNATVAAASSQQHATPAAAAGGPAPQSPAAQAWASQCSPGGASHVQGSPLGGPAASAATTSTTPGGSGAMKLLAQEYMTRMLGLRPGASMSPAKLGACASQSTDATMGGGGSLQQESPLQHVRGHGSHPAGSSSACKRPTPLGAPLDADGLAAAATASGSSSMTPLRNGHTLRMGPGTTTFAPSAAAAAAAAAPGSPGGGRRGSARRRL